MTITLTGTNSFLLKQQLDKLVDEFVAKYTDMGLERLDGEEAEYDRIRQSLESLPFLASKKLVVLRHPSANKEFLEKGVDVLKNLSEVTDVIIVEPKLDKRTAYYKFLKKNSEYIELNELDEHGLAKWLNDQAKTAGGSVSKSDATYLINRVGLNQQLLSNEIKKLLTYDPKISKETIDLLTEPTPQSSIFELLDAALAGNPKKAMELYKEQRALKVEPQQIIAMLAWQLHVLALVKTAEGRDAQAIAKEAKINPFVVRKTQNLARRMSLNQVKSLVERTLELDIKLKSQTIDADDALLELLISL